MAKFVLRTNLILYLAVALTVIFSSVILTFSFSSFPAKLNLNVGTISVPFPAPSTFSTNKDFAKSYVKLMVDIQNLYNDMIDQGIKAEDARYILPNATVTNIVMTCNLRQWGHICNLRLCTRAQWEIREVFKNIVSELEKQYPELIPIFDELLVPQCEILGYCPEPKSRCCGRKFNKDQVFNN